MFEDDLEGISDDDIENILETDDGDSKGAKTGTEDKTAVSKQPAKVDALDIAWETLKGGENKEKSKEKSLGLPDNTDTEGTIMIAHLE